MTFYCGYTVEYLLIIFNYEHKENLIKLFVKFSNELSLNKFFIIYSNMYMNEWDWNCGHDYYS